MVDTANVENGGCLYSEVKHLDTRDTSIVVTASVEDEGSLYSEVKHPDTRDKQIRSTSGGDTKCSEEIPGIVVLRSEGVGRRWGGGGGEGGGGGGGGGGGEKGGLDPGWEIGGLHALDVHVGA